MPRRYDAIICDIDGCLSPESSDPFNAPALTRIAEHNRLAQAQHDRPVLTLCSGRPQPFAEAMCRLLAITTLPVIAENGVWLYWPDTNRYDLDPRITGNDLRAVQAARDWVHTELTPHGIVMQPGKHASISLYHKDPDFLRSLEPRVRDAFQAHGWPFRVSMTWFYINCDLAHISKATAIARLCESTGLTKDRLAGIGDTKGDLLIADNVAFFACPSNAVNEIKARADYIAPLPEAEGVLDILEHLSK